MQNRNASRTLEIAKHDGDVHIQQRKAKGLTKLRLIYLALTLGLFPAPAWANSGIGFLMLAIPAVVLALLPVIFIEAPVLAAILRAPLGRGLMLSAGANFRSTWLGALIALAIDLLLMIHTGSSGISSPQGSVLLISLVPMFFITWWIEYRAIVRKQPDTPRPRVSLAVFTANAVSYVALAAVIVWTPLFKFYDEMGYPDRLSYAVYRAHPWQRNVQEYWTKNKRLPERTADIGAEEFKAPRDVRAMTLQAGGIIVVELNFPGEPALDGKRLLLSPKVSGDTISEWQCRAPDIPVRYAPHKCRGSVQ